MNLSLTEGWRKFLATMFLCVGVAFLTTNQTWQKLPQLEVGDIANQDIEAPMDFEYLDEDEMTRLQERIVSDAYAIYQLDGSKTVNIQHHISTAFQGARIAYQQLQQIPPSETDRDLIMETDWTQRQLDAIQKDFAKEIDVVFEPTEIQLLKEQGWSVEIEQIALRLVDESMQVFIIDIASSIPREGQSFDVVRQFGNQQDQITVQDTRYIKTLTESKQFVSVLAANITGVNSEIVQLGSQIAKENLQVNFTFDFARTQQYAQEQISNIQPVIRRVNRGLSIVRKGDKVSPSQAQILKKMLAEQNAGISGIWGEWILKFVMVGFISVGLYVFASLYIRKFQDDIKTLEVMVLLSLMVILVSKLLIVASLPFSVWMGLGMSQTALWYATPFAAGAMLLRILTNSETALIWIVATSIFVAFGMEENILFTAFFMGAGIVGAAGLTHTKDRLNILRAGLQTGLLSAAMALMLESFRMQSIVLVESQPLWDMGLAVLGGVVSSFVALGLLPIFESMGFVTDYKMLELANLNHPLLRQLFLRAPGTYHHSMTMSQLSEAAAEAIGANALEAKVACYYHDIGKSLQPQFFIENQRGRNPHDSLQPQQSARVIMTHVVDGLAMAKQHGLPQPILDAIEMHHGTGLIKYFYIRALEQAKENGTQVQEKDFRYVGKRPQTREAGIIFLADRVEAACRSLKDPSSEDFSNMIKKMVNDAITEEQLEECPLTLKELFTIMTVFEKTMTNMYHHRIEYPKMPMEMSPSPVITLEVPNPLLQNIDDADHIEKE